MGEKVCLNMLTGINEENKQFEADTKNDGEVSE